VTKQNHAFGLGSSRIALAVLLVSPAAAIADTGAVDAATSAQAIAGSPASDPQSTPSTSAGAAEIIVTATKQASPISRTPAAVTAISSAQLRPGGVQNIADLQVAVPNLSIGNQFGVNRTFIRGIGLNNFDIGGEGAVAFLQDGALIARPAAQLSGFYDLEQVEVLRGPQGILYGRGATGGAINLVTVKPTEDFAGYLRGTYGNYDSKVIEAAVGGGLIGDKLMIRVAGKYENHDGYGKNLFTGKDIDDRNSYSFRVTAVSKITNNLKATIVYDRLHEHDFDYAFHYFGPTVVPDSGLPFNLIGGKSIIGYYASLNKTPNFRNIYSNEDPINRRHGNGITGTLEWNLGDIDLKSITAYRTFWRFNRDDLDVSDVSLAGRSQYTERSHAFSQEVTGTYQHGALSLLGGAMYFHENLGGTVYTNVTNLGVLFGLPAHSLDDGAYLQDGLVRINAVGVYGQAALDLTSKLRVTAGVRYNYEHRKGTGFFEFDAAGIFVPTDVAKGWSSVTPKIQLEYKPTSNTLIYAGAVKGFKSGVINVGSQNPAINPETVWSYEAGIKQKFLDNRLLVSAAAFYYDYKNLQVSFVNAQSIVETINAASARNFGGEVELTGKVSGALDVNFHGSYLNAKFKKFCNAYYGSPYPARPSISYQPCPSDPALVDLSGKRLLNAPRWSFGGGFTYDVDLGDHGAVDLGANASWQSKVYFTEFNNADAEQKGYALVDANISYHPPSKRWSATIWAKNLTNKFAIANNIIAAQTYLFPRIGSVIPPRIYGGTLEWKF
jgi:iron complex outermembrane receptor protein